VVGGCGFIVNDAINGGLSGHFALSTSPRPELKPLDGSILFKFLLETRLQTQSFDTFDDLLGFRVEQL